MTKTSEFVRVSLILLMMVGAMGGWFLISQPYVSSKAQLTSIYGEVVGVQKVLPAEKSTPDVASIKIENVPALPPKAIAPLPIFPPKINYQILPQYPLSALEKGIEGIVFLSIYVEQTGHPEKIETKVSSGNLQLDQSAIAAISQWKFNPALQGGSAIGSWFEVPIKFTITE